MPVKFVVHERANPRDPHAPKKFYAMAKSSGELSLKRLSNRVSTMCSVNAGDVLAVLVVLGQVMNEEVAEGRIVRLGDLGSFSLSFNSYGSNTEAEVTAANIHSPCLRFRPGPDLNPMLKTLDYVRHTSPAPARPSK